MLAHAPVVMDTIINKRSLDSLSLTMIPPPTVNKIITSRFSGCSLSSFVVDVFSCFSESPWWIPYPYCPGKLTMEAIRQDHVQFRCRIDLVD